MIDGRDPVADRLPVAVDQCDVDWKIDPGARHHLPLEGIAMQVDDARQHQQTAGIDAGRAVAAIRAHGDDLAAGNPQRGFVDFMAEQGPATFNEQLCHDAALWLNCSWPDASADSYLSRKPSTSSLRKSGRARRSVS